MEDRQLIAALQGYQSEIQAFRAQVYEEMIDTITSGFAEHIDHHIIFNGLTARLGQQEEFTVTIGGLQYSSKPREGRLQDLRIDLDKAIASLNALKKDRQAIIQFAGDFSAEKIASLHAVVEFLMHLKDLHSDHTSELGELNPLRDLAREHGFTMDVSTKPDTSSRTDSELSTTFGGLELSLTKPSEEEQRLKVLVEFNRQLLAMYEMFFVRERMEGCTIEKARGIYPMGTPFILKRFDMTQKGYANKVGDKCIVEKLRIEYCDGCIFEGRSEDGVMFGSGSFRLASRAIFKGTISESMIAEGEIIDGNIRKKGKFKLRSEDSALHFESFGYTEVFENGQLIQALTRNEDGSASGWHKQGEAKLTGNWNSTGEFVSGKLETRQFTREGQFRNGQLTGSGKYSDPRVTYIGQFLDGEPHGKGTQISGSQRIEGQWYHQKLQSGVVTTPGFRYQGQFSDGAPHGQGTLTIGSARIEGMFSEGKPHGYCIYTDENVRYEGEYRYGDRHGKGRIFHGGKCVYNGDFADGKMHGTGTFTTDEFTYSGDIVRGSFEGNGTVKTKTQTYSGHFSNNQPNGWGTVTLSNGVSQRAFFKDGRST